MTDALEQILPKPPSHQLSGFINKDSADSKADGLEKAKKEFEIIDPAHLMLVDYNQNAIRDTLDREPGYQSLLLRHSSDIEWLAGFISRHELEVCRGAWSAP